MTLFVLLMRKRAITWGTTVNDGQCLQGELDNTLCCCIGLCVAAVEMSDHSYIINREFTAGWDKEYNNSIRENREKITQVGSSASRKISLKLACLLKRN